MKQKVKINDSINITNLHRDQDSRPCFVSDYIRSDCDEKHAKNTNRNKNSGHYMLELHHAFLNNLKEFWVNGYPKDKNWNKDMESAAENLIAMMKSNQFNINEEKDNDGNTLLHLVVEIHFSTDVYSLWYYPARKIIKTALQMGADPTIKNNKN